MGLVVKELRLADFRSFERLELHPSEGVTVLVGPNAAGKTNTVEALQLLTAGSSFRKPTPRQLVRDGAESARIDARLEGDGRVVDVRCDVTTTPPARRFSRNGKRCQASEVPESLMSVLFSPDDLALVKRGASVRRDELDDFGRQANRGYANVLAAYLRSVEQRNRLLKDEFPDEGLIEAWDSSVSLGGATLLHARLRLFSPYLTFSDLKWMVAFNALIDQNRLLYRTLLSDTAPLPTRYEVPVLMFAGTEDWTTPYSVARSYFQNISAPQKRFFSIENAGHIPFLDQPQVFSRALEDTLKDLARG